MITMSIGPTSVVWASITYLLCCWSHPASDVRPALVRDPLAEADQRRVRGDPSRHERLALGEGPRAVDEPRRDEREDTADVPQVGRRVHPHQNEVVALREHVLVDL